jgi:hypothetical protein
VSRRRRRPLSVRPSRRPSRRRRRPSKYYLQHVAEASLGIYIEKILEKIYNTYPKITYLL